LTLPLALCLLWLIAANLIGMLPSRDLHWRAAYAMIAIGLPIWLWLVWAGGAVIGLVILIAAGSVLRWPVVYLARWLRRMLGVVLGPGR
jgi:hypothetical protein